MSLNCHYIAHYWDPKPLLDPFSYDIQTPPTPLHSWNNNRIARTKMTIYGFFTTILYEVRELETDSHFTNTINAAGDLIEEIGTL